MCTLIVLHRCVPGRPLVVAANRDEFLDRPAEGPALRSSRTGPIVAPRDLEAGGTWVGVSARGVFAGLTNLRPTTAPEEKTGSEDRLGGLASRASGAWVDRLDRAMALRDRRAESELRSRGEVVTMALESESAADAIETLSRLEKETYNPFQLLVADGHEAWLVVYRGSGRAVRLEPGPHIVGNVVDERIETELGLAAAESSGPVGSVVLAADEEPRARKLTRIRTRVEKLMTEPGRDYFDGLARICREHVEDATEDATEGGREEDQSPFESTCVHVANRYGTRSSLLLELSTDPATNRLWTTDGPPCERSFENRSSLLRELDVRLSNRVGTEPT
jgi:uncharacterized protein with NRDE domain